MGGHDSAAGQAVRAVVGVHLIVAALLATLVVVLAFLPLPDAKPMPPHHFHVFGAVFVTWLAVTMRLVARSVRRRVGAVLRGERDVVTLRRELARVALAWWMGGAALYALVIVLLDHPVQDVVRLALLDVLGGIAVVALTDLRLELALAPVVARRRGVPDAGVPMPTRIVRSWALASGIPTVAVAVLFVSGGADTAEDVGLVLLVGLAVLAGWAWSASFGASLGARLRGLRTAVERIEAGDLNVEVAVDDLGELGLLQQGVNRMAAGLRERERLSDLFGRHVGEDVARLALAGRPGLSGEECEVSVFFVDLVGSTALAETRVPAEVVATLDALFEAVVEATEAEGGLVNKFLGDAALCVFGAPRPVDDHAARCLAAAVRLQQALARLRLEHPGLDAAIGAATGRVIAGNVGAISRYEYTVIGDAVNQAARLTELAKERPARLVATDALVRAAEASGWAPLGEVVLRGRTAPTAVWEPAQIAGPTRTDSAAASA